ncbi:MAG: energy transducer TonB [Bacteroidetes bacterium]|nr:energy transducer TonB [Bacteroidota bacterium]
MRNQITKLTCSVSFLLGKGKFLLIVMLLFLLVGRLVAQGEYEVCEMEAESAWEGDTIALQKFVTTCGKVDTLNLDSLNERTSKNPTYQRITMKLNNGKVIRSDSIYFVAETMPQFKNGTMDIINYMSHQIQYPAKAKNDKIAGTVLVSFIVGRDGTVSNVKIVKGLPGGLSEEAIRVVSQMPKWTPGKMHGMPVRVKYTMPVRFKLS